MLRGRGFGVRKEAWGGELSRWTGFSAIQLLMAMAAFGVLLLVLSPLFITSESKHVQAERYTCNYPGDVGWRKILSFDGMPNSGLLELTWCANPDFGEIPAAQCDSRKLIMPAGKPKDGDFCYVPHRGQAVYVGEACIAEDGGKQYVKIYSNSGPG